MVDKPVQLRPVHGDHSFISLGGGIVKFPVSRLLLFQALDVGGKLIGCLDDGVHLGIAFVDVSLIAAAQLLRHQGQQLIAGDPLYLLIGLADIVVVILDGCRQVAR